MTVKLMTVDDYISHAPIDVQVRLKSIREAIKSTVPTAAEKISYGMPYYGYKGRLVYFAYFKKHIGLYIPPPVFENHAHELKKFITTKATVQFPLDSPLPIPLIKKLVKASAKINDATK